MQRDPRAWLWDALDSAAAIQTFVAGLDVEHYAGHALVHSAVERKFEIIGEALNQLSRAAPELAERVPHLPQIVAFRNQLIHGYALVDHVTVWAVIQQSLPELKDAISKLLTSLDPA